MKIFQYSYVFVRVFFIDPNFTSRELRIILERKTNFVPGIIVP